MVLPRKFHTNIAVSSEQLAFIPFYVSIKTCNPAAGQATLILRTLVFM